MKGRENCDLNHSSQIMNKIQNSLISAASAINNKAFAFMAMCGAATLPIIPVFATGDGTTDLFDAAKSLINTIYSGIFGITTALAIVCAIIAALFLIFSRNQKTVESAIGWLKRILIGWLIINGLGLIITSLTSWLSAAGVGNADSFMT